MPRWRVLTSVALLVVAACSGDGEGGTTTTAAEDASTTTTTTGPAGTTSSSPATTVRPTTTTSTTSTTFPDEDPIPDYQIEARLTGDAGDTVVVSLLPAPYSDLDIENVVSDVLQRFAPIVTVHVVDDAAIVDLVLADEATLTAEQVASRDAHYYARLEEGFRLVFEGPFAAFPQVVLGS